MNKILDAQGLVKWAENNDILFRLSVEKAEVIIQTYSGFGYQVIDNNNGFIIKDPLKNKMSNIAKIDDLIDLACEWNWDQKFNYRNKLANPANVENTVLKKQLKRITQNEQVLNELYKQTVYGKSTPVSKGAKSR